MLQPVRACCASPPRILALQLIQHNFCRFVVAANIGGMHASFRYLFQAELDRVTRWEERLAAEAASLQRREEAHKVLYRGTAAATYPGAAVVGASNYSWPKLARRSMFRGVVWLLFSSFSRLSEGGTVPLGEAGSPGYPSPTNRCGQREACLRMSHTVRRQGKVHVARSPGCTTDSSIQSVSS